MNATSMLFQRRECGIHALSTGAGRLGSPPANRRGESSNLVKITKFGAGEELAPFLDCELAERTIGIICIAYYDKAVLARDFNACPGVTGTRDIPLEITGR
jgi:hypothetical protein